MKPPKGTRDIFIRFLVREGVPRLHAVWEYDNMLTVNGQAVLRDWYLHASRVGAPFAIDRARRASIYESFCNAQNHATFDA